jgi:ABC-type antimicrobial peptide transport system permease subunit
VPRFVYPDKPERTLGQEFGHRYDILDVNDLVTSINFEQLVEMYANFGAWGVILGMAIVGLLYRVLRRFIGTGERATLIGAKIYVGMLAIESDFSLVHGAVIQQIIVFYLFLRLIDRPDVRTPSRSESLPHPVPVGDRSAT